MPLQLVFADPEVRKMCECQASAENALGSRSARLLRARLADLCAADKISDVVAGSPKPASRSTFVIALHNPHKLVLEAAMNPIPKKNNKIDWDAIDCFRVLAVD